MARVCRAKSTALRPLSSLEEAAVMPTDGLRCMATKMSAKVRLLINDATTKTKKVYGQLSDVDMPVHLLPYYHIGWAPTGFKIYDDNDDEQEECSMFVGFTNKAKTTSRIMMLAPCVTSNFMDYEALKDNRGIVVGYQCFLGETVISDF